jgi:leucyl aminopeptidase
MYIIKIHVTAGQFIFLYQFIKNYKWAHLDIAPRMISIAGEYLAVGALGTPVRLLYKMIEEYK